MLNKVKQYIESNRMLRNKEKVVLGVSGGADSVCLFFVLLALKEIYQLELHVVHVNHMLRGKEAQRDQEYVEKICRENNVPFHLFKSDVRKLAKEEHLSEEEAGRNLRYQVFETVRKEYNCDVIAVAHNSNDCAETMIFQLARGSGLTGLTSIQAVRGDIIRPLLCLTRQEIEQYLKQRNIPYQIDATNLEDKYSRNKIRLHVLPYLVENINRQSVAHIVNTAQMLKEVEDYVEKQTNICYNNLVKESADRYTFCREEFLREDIVIQKAMIRRIINNLSGQLRDIESVHIADICNLATKGVGKKIDLPYHIEAYNDYKNLILTQNVSNHKDSLRQRKDVEYPLIDETIIENINPGMSENVLLTIPQYRPNTDSTEQTNVEYAYHIGFEICKIEENHKEFREQVIQNPKSFIKNQRFQEEYKNSMINIRNGYTKCFDYDKIKNAVQLRTRQEGDYLQIDANGGTKKLKSLFIDNKVPQSDRCHIPLLADGSHIMWVFGSRISEAYKINENTKTMLIVYIFGGK